MAGKFLHSSDSANRLYFLVYRISDSYIYDVTTTDFEAVGVWNDARVDECYISMTATGDVHTGTFPVVDADVYFVQIRIMAGGSVDTDDKPAGQGISYWDGTNFFNSSTLNTQIEDDVIGASDTLETISDELDTISGQVNTVFNIYGPGE